jgi:hypothetical protein
MAVKKNAQPLRKTKKSPPKARKEAPSGAEPSKTANPGSLTPDQARKVLQADLARIVQKVKDRKPLSSTERNLMSQMATEETPGKSKSAQIETPDHVPSVSALAGILGVSRRSIQLWRRKYASEIPSNRTNGNYDVAAWREFVRRKGLKEGRPEENDDDEEDMESLKKRDLRARAEEREFKVSILMGEYLHKEDVRESVAELVAETIKLLRDKLENELPPVCAGLDAVRIRAENSRVIDDICELLHRGEVGEKMVEEDDDAD